MSLRILFATDLHLRAIKPVSRLDEDFLGSLIRKIDALRTLSARTDVVILGGDIFDRPDASHGVVSKAINAFARFKVPVYSLVGNHDIYGYQGQTLDRTAMGVLFEAGVVKKLDTLELDGIIIQGLHAYDKNEWSVPGHGTRVLVAHKMLTDRPFPGGACHLINDVATQTNAHLVLSGDIHYPHDVTVDGHRFINPGSLSRQSISDRDRLPMAAEVTITGKEISCQLHQLDGRAPEVVFDMDGYASRVAMEERATEFAKSMARDVISVKGDATAMAPALTTFLNTNNASESMHATINGYREQAELAVLAESKE